MNGYQTFSTVEDEGHIHIAGVPFAPGTEVEITISPKVQSDDSAAEMDDQTRDAARSRMRELFKSVRGFRISPKISREELYERGSLH